MEIKYLPDLSENLDSYRKPITAKDRIEGEIPYYGASGIVDYVKDYIFDEELLLVSEDGANLVMRSTPIAFSISGKTWVNNHAHVLRFKDRKLQAFVEYYLNSIDLSPYISGTAQPKLNQQMLNTIPIPVPSDGMIENTVAVLDRIVSIRKQREKELEELDYLIKARFVEMFGDINVNDKNWDSEPLGNLCTIVRGGSPRPIENFLGGDVPWIKIGDATDGDNIYLNSTKEHIIREGVKKSRLVKSGSLIFANCGVSLGFARIITFDGCIHDGWLAMEDIDERLDKVFLLQALNQMTEHFRAIAPAGTQPNLNTAIMKAYNQVIPPVGMQREFIRFAEQVDKSKVVVQKSLDETQKLFDSLMQGYFG